MGSPNGVATTAKSPSGATFGITYTELISILNEFGARDEATHTKAIEVKAKRDEEKRKTRRRKWATKAPEIVRDAQGNSVHGSKPDRSKKKRSSAMARL